MPKLLEDDVKSIMNTVMQDHFFYVLKCNDDSFYAGYTTNLERRLNEHNSGKGAKYTRVDKRRPVVLYHHEKFMTKPDAMKQEYAFKQLTRKEKEFYLSSFLLNLNS